MVTIYFVVCLVRLLFEGGIYSRETNILCKSFGFKKKRGNQKQTNKQQQKGLQRAWFWVVWRLQQSFEFFDKPLFCYKGIHTWYFQSIPSFFFFGLWLHTYTVPRASKSTTLRVIALLERGQTSAYSEAIVTVSSLNRYWKTMMRIASLRAKTRRSWRPMKLY